MDFKQMGSAVKDEAGVPFHVPAPDGMLLYAKKDDAGNWGLTAEKNDKPCELIITSQYSERFRNRKREMFKKAQSKKSKQDYDEAEEEDFHTVAAAVVGWNNIPSDGKIAKFSQAGLLELFENAPWIYEEANKFIVANDRFFTSASML
jgi:hypothetical protein